MFLIPDKKLQIVTFGTKNDNSLDEAFSFEHNICRSEKKRAKFILHDFTREEIFYLHEFRKWYKSFQRFSTILQKV